MSPSVRRGFARPVLLLAAAAFVAPAVWRLAQGPDLAQRLTFSGPAMRADRLLAALSRQTGVPLACAPELRDEVLLLDVRGVPLSDALARLAEAAGGEWVTDGWQLTLRLSDPRSAAARKRGEREREARLRDGVRPLLAALREPWSGTAVRAAALRCRQNDGSLRMAGDIRSEADRKLALLDPGLRAYARCMRDVPLSAVAALPVGAGLSFATAPGSGVRPLGAAADEALRLLHDEQLVFGRALEASHVVEPWEDAMLAVYGDHPEMTADHQPWQRAARYRRRPAAALLTVRRTGPWDYDWALKLLDSRGQAVMTLDVDATAQVTQSWLPAESPDETPPHGPWIQLSPTSLALERYLGQMLRTQLIVSGLQFPAPAPGRRPAVPPEFKAILLHPEEHDPLGGLATDALRSLARLRGRNLAADLPDRLLEGAWLWNPGIEPLSVDHFLAGPRGETPVHIQEEGAWLLVRARDADLARQERGDRAVLGRLLRKADRIPRLTLEGEAIYVAGMRDSPLENFGCWMLSTATGASFDSGAGDRNLLLLFGSLTDAQRQSLRRGEVVPYTAMGDPARRAALRAVEGTSTNCSWTGRALFTDSCTLSEDPTTAYPRPLPAGGQIRLRASRDRRVVFVASDGAGQQREIWCVPISDGPRMHFGGDRYLLTGKVGPPSYQPRSRPVVTIEADATAGSSIAAEFYDGPEVNEGPPVRLEQLPVEARPAVRDELRWLWPLHR